jgi:uncharacterized protein (DUF2235 family)
MKRIITCSDGTWNRPGVADKGKLVRTNVQKIFEAISKYDAQKQVYQLKYYNEGIGAEGNWWTRVMNGATGKGIDENILSSYKFIMWNYEPGDEIYLFGFSRGAYTARSLAGLIRNCGILKNNDLSLIQEAYNIYRDRTDATVPKSEIAQKFKEQNSYEISNIKFIGVWDTVGSLGIPLNAFQVINKRKYAFHDTTLSSIIDNAFHALSIDERRKNFQPTLWNQSKDVVKRATPQVLEQRWFPGVHSNIGGGYPDESLSDITLQWMIGKAKDTGLVFENDFLTKNIKSTYKGTIYNSYVFPYTLGKKYIRPIAKATDSVEMVDESAIQRFNDLVTYKSTNLENYLKSKESSKE